MKNRAAIKRSVNNKFNGLELLDLPENRILNGSCAGTLTSYELSTAACAFTSVVFFIIDSGEFGSLYATDVPPAEEIIGIFGLYEGLGGSVDILKRNDMFN